MPTPDRDRLGPLILQILDAQNPAERAAAMRVVRALALESECTWAAEVAGYMVDSSECVTAATEASAAGQPDVARALFEAAERQAARIPPNVHALDLIRAIAGQSSRSPVGDA